MFDTTDAPRQRHAAGKKDSSGGFRRLDLASLEAERPVSDVTESLGAKVASMIVLFLAMCLLFLFVNAVFHVDLLDWTSSLFRKHGI